jgi:hypothetical protein
MAAAAAADAVGFLKFRAWCSSLTYLHRPLQRWWWWRWSSRRRRWWRRRRLGRERQRLRLSRRRRPLVDHLDDTFVESLFLCRSNITACSQRRCFLVATMYARTRMLVTSKAHGYRTAD